jgi:hypothetical protein
MAAIYQWFPTSEVTYTTTLYPIEAKDGMNFAFDIDIGGLTDVAVDPARYNPDFMGAWKAEVLFDTSLDEDAQYAAHITGIGKGLSLEEAGPFDEEGEYAAHFIDAFKEHKLIRGWMPDEGMDFAFDLDTANCSLTNV